MRRISVPLAAGLMVAALLPSTIASASDGRVVEAEYVGSAALAGNRSSGTDGDIGFVRFQTFPNERFVRVELVDDSGQEACGEIRQDRNGDGFYERNEEAIRDAGFCGTTKRPVEIVPGVELVVFIYGLCVDAVPNCDQQNVQPMTISGIARATFIETTPPATSPVRGCSSGNVTKDGRWTYIRSSFPADDRDHSIRSYAVDPSDPRVLFITNGESVMRSNDAGCSWKTVFEAGMGALGPQKIRGISISHSLKGKTRVFLTGGETGPLQGVIMCDELAVPGTCQSQGNPLREIEPFVLVSDDAGNTWAPAGQDGGLGDYGHAVEVTVAPSDPNIMYAQVHERSTSGVLARLYQSTDAGASWAPVIAEVEQFYDVPVVGQRVPYPSQEITKAFDVEIDPLDANSLWVSPCQRNASCRAKYSSDGAASWQQADSGISNNVIDISHDPGQPQQILLFQSWNTTGSGIFARSTDGGASWARYGSPANSSSVARGATPSSIVVTTSYSHHPSRAANPSGNPPSGVYALDVKGGDWSNQNNIRWLDITPPGPWPNFDDVTADRSAKPSYFVRTADYLLRYSPPRSR